MGHNIWNGIRNNNSNFKSVRNKNEITRNAKHEIRKNKEGWLIKEQKEGEREEKKKKNNIKEEET